MAKGQKRGNREIKKPKASAKKPNPGAAAVSYQLPVRPAPAKSPAR